jgi:hypothetical protein
MKSAKPLHLMLRIYPSRLDILKHAGDFSLTFKIEQREQQTRAELGDNPTQAQMVDRWQGMRSLYAARRLMANRHPGWPDAAPYRTADR